MAGLRRERLRSDRTGDPFCWVLFGMPALAKGDLSLRHLAYLIAGRVRSTDEVGWHDDASVGVILPATDREGAEQFVADVVRLAARKHLQPTGGRFRCIRERAASRYDSGRRNSEMVLVGRAAKGSEWRHLTAFYLCAVSGAGPFPLTSDCAILLALLSGSCWRRPFLFLAAIVRSGSPPLARFYFGQRRAGLGCSPFTMYKFRSMYVDAEVRKQELRHLNEQDGPAFKIKNDPRVTPVGRFLRATSIDELPQLFNVLKGDMSLVGPRPPTFDEVGEYRRWYLRRLDVTPGLTCTWQVEGRSRVSFEQWMRMDLQYIDRQSLWLDFKLIAKTLPALLLRRGY